MTDNPIWQPPAGAERAQPSPWATTQLPVSPAGWSPPPKPGLIPLRPLSFGTILGSSFRVMRRNPAPTFGLAVLLYGFVAVVYVAVMASLFAFSFSRLGSATTSDQDAIFAGTIGLLALSALIPVGLAVIATAVLQGIIALEVSRATLGEKLRIRGLWRLAKGKVGALIGWATLQTVAVVVLVLFGGFAAFAVFAATGASMATSTSSDPTSGLSALLAAMVVLLLVGGAFAVLGSWLGTKLSLVPSIIMLERLGLGASMARSWSLTNANFWRTLGIQLLIAVIINFGSSIITTPVSLVVGLATTLINPNSDPMTSAITIAILYVVLGILSIVLGAIGLVMQSSSLSFIYIDIRMRKEGLDLDLLHYVEAKQAGGAAVANPYETGNAQPAAAVSGSPWA